MTQVEQQLILTEMRWEAENIVSLALRHPEGADLPDWEPGAHIEVTLPSGKIRQYSLCGDPSDKKVYRVAVLRVTDGRGGSNEIHSSLRVGGRYFIRGPRNNFKLEPASSYLFLAGGIGITPLLPMMNAMTTSLNWRAIYCGRSRASMAFVDDLEAQCSTCVLTDNRDGRPDFEAEIDACEPGTRIYCCGPAGMIDAVSAAAARRSDVTLCTERFEAVAPPKISSGSANRTELVLARSGLTLSIEPHESVLDAVLRVKPEMPRSCEAGFCGTCEVAIIKGEVEHLDQLHSEAEREENRTMMICVSRPLSSPLVLDL
jgi:ferredoxin-NADP reductase